MGTRICLHWHGWKTEGNEGGWIQYNLYLGRNFPYSLLSSHQSEKGLMIGIYHMMYISVNHSATSHPKTSRAMMFDVAF